jgi:hypothetical protein
MHNRMHAFAVDGGRGLADIGFETSRRSETYLRRTPDSGYVYWYRGGQRDGFLVIWMAGPGAG